MGKLDGKIAIVTGGSRGQGASHVRKFVREGAKVVFTDILVEEGEALSKEIGESVKFIKHDVAIAKDWGHVVYETERVFGHVNILVNNAGFGGVSSRIEDLTEEEYRKVIDINQVGTFLGMKYVIPSMKKTDKGSIINISSVAGFRGTAFYIAYDASKFAIRGMTKSAALEFAEYGIRVNSVHPGVIQTPILEGHEELIDMMEQGIPFKRLGTVEESSSLIAFLASDESSYSTGSEFTLDGGKTASNN